MNKFKNILPQVVIVFELMMGAAVSVSAATSYVDNQNSSANDSNPGTATLPWKTIQKAATSAVAGDRVIIKRGEYKEFVTMQQSGTAGNPIVFEGERGLNGEWLTIIDPSTPLSTGWVLAPEIGAGVWKQTSVPFTTGELSIDNKRAAFVKTIGDMTSDITAAYSTSGLTTGAQFLALPSNAVLTMSGRTFSINFWDGVEALWGPSGNVTYLRLRNGNDPNGLNIRAAPGAIGVGITDQSYLTLRNLLIRGTRVQVYITGANAHHNTIENDYISAGFSRVNISGGAHDNVVQNNEMTENYYGYDDPGAWGNGVGSKYYIRENLYTVSKWLMGFASSDDDAVHLSSAGNNNVISRNHIFKGMGSGIAIGGDPANPTQNTEISNNTIENEPSIGILLSEGHTGTKIHDNMIADCNLSLRFHHMDTGGETDRKVYIYRNKLWLPTGIGDHIYAHFNHSTPSTYVAEFWVYHNSFSGGNGAMTASSYAYATNGLRNLSFLNNIFSGTRYWSSDDSAWLNPTTNTVRMFDYNLTTPPYPTYPSTAFPVWFGPHNIKATAAEWVNTLGMSFQLVAGSLAVDAAIDVTQPFVMNGITYPALPFTAEQKNGSAWDIGAYEYVNSTMVAPVITTQPVSQTVTVPATATFSVAASGSPGPTYQWQSAPSGSSTFAAISGATATSYNTGATSTSMSGTQYRCVATNSAGSATSNVAILTVNAFPVVTVSTLTSSPAGRTLVVDGTSYSAAQIFNWAPGSTHTLNTSSPQSGAAGIRYVFSSWSDGGAQSHTYATPSSAATVTAAFSTQYQLSTAVSPVGSGSVSPASGGWYTSGSVVSCAASANSGFNFVSWTGDLSGSANSQNVTLSAPRSVTANFNTAPVITSAPTATPNPASVGQAVSFTAAASDANGDPLSYSWAFGDGTTGSGSSTSHSYAAAGTYAAVATISDGRGGSVSGSVSVVVNGGLILQNGLNGYAGTRDTYLNKGSPNRNYGSNTSLQSDRNASSQITQTILVRFAIFQFEGGPVPNNAIIQSATLSLYKYSSYDHTYAARRLLKSWNELEASWNSAAIGTAWSTPGALGSGTDLVSTADGQAYVGSTAAWLNLDVTAGVKAFAAGAANDGWHLLEINGKNSTKKFYSREYTGSVSLRPKLSINYTLP